MPSIMVLAQSGSIDNYKNGLGECYMRYFILVPLFVLGACGGSAQPASEDQPQASSTPEKYDCSDLIESVIRIADGNGLTIAKIYAPTKVGGSELEPVCKGNAMVSTSPDRQPIFFKRTVDEDGDGVIQYSGDPFPASNGK